MTELTGPPSRYPPPPGDRISGSPSGPPSGRFSLPPGVPAPPPDPTLFEAVGGRFVAFLNHLGRMSTIFAQAIGAKLDPGWQILAGHLTFLVVLAIRPQGLFPKVQG